MTDERQRHNERNLTSFKTTPPDTVSVEDKPVSIEMLQTTINEFSEYFKCDKVKALCLHTVIMGLRKYHLGERDPDKIYIELVKQLNGLAKDLNMDKAAVVDTAKAIYGRVAEGNK